MQCVKQRFLEARLRCVSNSAMMRSRHPSSAGYGPSSRRQAGLCDLRPRAPSRARSSAFCGLEIAFACSLGCQAAPVNLNLAALPSRLGGRPISPQNFVSQLPVRIDAIDGRGAQRAARRNGTSRCSLVGHATDARSHVGFVFASYGIQSRALAASPFFGVVVIRFHLLDFV